MLVKICGLKHPENLREVVKCQPNLIGLIFYSGSERNVEPNLELIEALAQLKTKKVGVFVNETKENILKKAADYNLDYVQLHGSESPAFCKDLKKDIRVIKAFRIRNVEDLSMAEEYENCDFLLFDAKGPKPGGNGIQFDWTLLRSYNGRIPFLLSGGVHLSDIANIKKIDHPKLAGVDVNSGFELAPGIKNIELIEELMNEIRYEYV